jgi:hypothetical protein
VVIMATSRLSGRWCTPHTVLLLSSLALVLAKPCRFGGWVEGGGAATM